MLYTEYIPINQNFWHEYMACQPPPGRRLLCMISESQPMLNLLPLFSVYYTCTFTFSAWPYLSMRGQTHVREERDNKRNFNHRNYWSWQGYGCYGLDQFSYYIYSLPRLISMEIFDRKQYLEIESMWIGSKRMKWWKEIDVFHPISSNWRVSLLWRAFYTLYSVLRRYAQICYYMRMISDRPFCCQ